MTHCQYCNIGILCYLPVLQGPCGQTTCWWHSGDPLPVLHTVIFPCIAGHSGDPLPVLHTVIFTCIAGHSGDPLPVLHTVIFTCISGSMWTNYVLVAASGVCLPLLMVMKEEYNRLEIDEHNPSLNAEIVIPPPDA